MVFEINMAIFLTIFSTGPSINFLSTILIGSIGSSELQHKNLVSSSQLVSSSLDLSSLLVIAGRELSSFSSVSSVRFEIKGFCFIIDRGVLKVLRAPKVP